MTHGYDFFDYDYVDLDDYFVDVDDYLEWDAGISEDWSEIVGIYDEYEEGTGIEGWD